MKNILLIDYENVQEISLDALKESDVQVLLFVGRSQGKIPFELVRQAQGYGEALRWIKIEGDGKNNLDFHIAYELGRLSSQIGKEAKLFVLSKDKGYDSLIAYMKTECFQALRISSVAQLPFSKKGIPHSEYTDEVISNLKKIAAGKRPRTASSLKKHVVNNFGMKASPADIQVLIEELFVKGLISEKNNRIAYNFCPASGLPPAPGFTLMESFFFDILG